MDKLSIRLVTQSRAFHDLDFSVHCKKYLLHLLQRFEGIQLVGQRYEIIQLRTKKMRMHNDSETR